MYINYTIPPCICTFFLYTFLIYNITIIATRMTMMMKNIPPTAPPTAAPAPDDPLLLASDAVN